MSREKFYLMKERLAEARSINNQANDEGEAGEEKKKKMMDNNDKMVAAIRARYKTNQDGEVHSLIYLHVVTDAGLEISGHLDLSDRLATENFLPYLTGATLQHIIDLITENHKGEYSRREKTSSPSWRPHLLQLDQGEGQVLFLA